jgi:hypothetical protein
VPAFGASVRFVAYHGGTPCILYTIHVIHVKIYTLYVYVCVYIEREVRPSDCVRRNTGSCVARREGERQTVMLQRSRVGGKRLRYCGEGDVGSGVTERE